MKRVLDSSLGALTMVMALVLALGACGEPSTTEQPTEPVTAIELGTGEWMFEPLVADQRLQLAAGTQGGHHIWLSLRARGLVGERLRMKLELLSTAAVPMASSELDLRFEPSEAIDGSLEYVGWPAQLLVPWCAVEHPLSVRVSLTDPAGRSASATIDVVPTAPVHGFSQTCEPG
jgi:hypothetical protein